MLVLQVRFVISKLNIYRHLMCFWKLQILLHIKLHQGFRFEGINEKWSATFFSSSNVMWMQVFQSANGRVRPPPRKAFVEVKIWKSLGLLEDYA